MRREVFITALLALALALLGACTLSPRDTGRSYMLSLNAIKTAPQELIGTHLVVALPETAPDFDTGRVALIRGAHIRDYYAGLRWADFLPSLVQDGMINTLQGSGLFKAVAGDTAGLPAERLLKTDIRAFQAEYSPGHEAPLVHIRIAVRLQSRLDRKTISAFDIDASRRAAQNDAPAIHTAFQSAFSAVLAQLVEQLGQHP